MLQRRIECAEPAAALSRTTDDGPDLRCAACPAVRWRGEEAGFSFRDAGYAPLADFDGSLK
jgi:hypothetical protein